MSTKIRKLTNADTLQIGEKVWFGQIPYLFQGRVKGGDDRRNDPATNTGNYHFRPEDHDPQKRIRGFTLPPDIIRTMIKERMLYVEDRLIEVAIYRYTTSGLVSVDTQMTEGPAWELLWQAQQVFTNESVFMFRVKRDVKGNASYYLMAYKTALPVALIPALGKPLDTDALAQWHNEVREAIKRGAIDFIPAARQVVTGTAGEYDPFADE